MKLKKWIRPATGLALTEPDTGETLAITGGEVLWTSWWQRRLNDGDVVETTEQAVVAAARKAAKEGDK